MKPNLMEMLQTFTPVKITKGENHMFESYLGKSSTLLVNVLAFAIRNQSASKTTVDSGYKMLSYRRETALQGAL